VYIPLEQKNENTRICPTDQLTRPKNRLRKVIFIGIGFLASFVALITVLAFIFAEIQQPGFVNRDLMMQN